eukprot:3939295-Rhodomonas_salina.1
MQTQFAVQQRLRARSTCVRFALSSEEQKLRKSLVSGRASALCCVSGWRNTQRIWSEVRYLGKDVEGCCYQGKAASWQLADGVGLPVVQLWDKAGILIFSGTPGTQCYRVPAVLMKSSTIKCSEVDVRLVVGNYVCQIGGLMHFQRLLEKQKCQPKVERGNA